MNGTDTPRADLSLLAQAAARMKTLDPSAVANRYGVQLYAECRGDLTAVHDRALRLAAAIVAVAQAEASRDVAQVARGAGL